MGRTPATQILSLAPAALGKRVGKGKKIGDTKESFQNKGQVSREHKETPEAALHLLVTLLLWEMGKHANPPCRCINAKKKLTFSYRRGGRRANIEQSPIVKDYGQCNKRGRRNNDNQ
jgi:hypothetical protein